MQHLNNEKKILYISNDKIKTNEVLKILNSIENWVAISATSELQAIQLFLEHDPSMAIFAYDIKKDIKHNLSQYYRNIKPGILLLDPYGGGTGFLQQEINHAFENEKSNRAIS
jgi:hypothetical protein